MILKPPNKITTKIINNYYKIFLAGSIENGKAIQWQSQVEKELDRDNIYILNPRRDDWNANWIQSIKNKQFRTQVNWELDGQECADLILMYFDPNTKSPITLLELGLFGDFIDMIVCCPEGFYRKGNVDIVCKRLGIKQAKDLNELIKMAKKKINGRIV